MKPDHKDVTLHNKGDLLKGVTFKRCAICPSIHIHFKKLKFEAVTLIETRPRVYVLCMCVDIYVWTWRESTVTTKEEKNEDKLKTFWAHDAINSSFVFLPWVPYQTHVPLLFTLLHTHLVPWLVRQQRVARTCLTSPCLSCQSSGAERAQCWEKSRSDVTGPSLGRPDWPSSSSWCVTGRSGGRHGGGGGGGHGLSHGPHFLLFSVTGTLTQSGTYVTTNELDRDPGESKRRERNRRCMKWYSQQGSDYPIGQDHSQPSWIWNIGK